MPTATQKVNLSQAVSQIRIAEVLLLQSARAATDPTVLGKINAEYLQLDSALTQILHAQACTDDATFDSLMLSLKQQSNLLQVNEAAIQAIVNDVATAARIASCIAQAIAFIAAV